jgi:hemerythrin
MTFRLAPELVVGYEAIDAQHRELFQRLEAAAEAARSETLPRTREAVAALGDYLVTHFAYEEQVMAAAQYAERGKHKAAHDIFMQDFMQLQQELTAAGLAAPIVHWIANRVPEWVRFHIQVNDAPLGRYLTAKRFAPDLAGRADKPRAS